MPDAPLAGLRVLVTRPADQCAPWIEALRAVGAVPIPYPTIEVRPPASWAPFDRAIASLASYAWLVFTSANVVRFATPRLPSPAALPSTLRIAAVGPETTRALQDRGFTVAFTPEDARQEGLAAELAREPSGTRVLFPRSKEGREWLVDALAAHGISVDVVPASETSPVADLPAVPPHDVALFASPSALRALVDRHGTAPLASSIIVTIGPTTLAAARSAGLAAAAAASPDINGIIESIVAANARR